MADKEKKKYVIYSSDGSNHQVGEETLFIATTMLTTVRQKDANAKLAEMTNQGAITLDL